VSAVVFDLGNVVVEWNPHAVMTQAFIDETDFFTWNTELDRGASFADTIASVRERFPHHAEGCDAFRDRWQDTIGPAIAETVEVIHALKTRGVRCYALSNSSAETLPRSALVQEVLAKFDGVLVSGEVGLLKPDFAIYAAAVERFGLDPSTTWFVDDNKPNVDAAIACGWNGIHFTGPESLAPLADL
jgi:2-haloacid dehalogenase